MSSVKSTDLNQLRISLAGSLPLVILLHLSLVFFCPGTTQAEGDLFFHTRNQHPLVQIYGMPAPESPFVPSVGKSVFHLDLAQSNSLSSQYGSHEYLLVDGESTRVDLGFRYGLGHGWELGGDLPYLSHSGGFLDGFIEDWHGFFHLPNGERGQRQNGLLDYRYERDGRVLLQLNSASDGVSDLLLFAGYGLAVDGVPVAIRIGLKLPTGSSSEMLGSGGVDMFVSGSALIAGGPSSQWQVYGHSGVLLTGHSEILNEIRRDLIGFGALGISWAYHPRVIFKLQIDGHTPFYRSDLNGMGLSTLQLDMGGTLVLSEGLNLDLAVLEDIIVDSAPDVVFMLGLVRHY
ncbi:MAG: DUF3187 family protein [Proteobacteria bacterium]|nr:DUF3187 family protein [Pseudomonadota bacterium]MBU1688963.1 DUF3187 family protein [Pseudomonadota bacterium]